MNSKWKANKIGLVDFWYYDIQEFYFSEGRMLLRGSNGSGKSVTMQSFIPLLLDGNMRPERLDPFGSRARKMENYLLEENDPREERTGYLYMEFKREETETYITIGMGMRARKNKKLDPWYFILFDGRRINEDFMLYKEMHNKLVLTKKELRNRMEEGGRVFDTQNEYMEEVNKQIFGFETLDEYKEMIDLLIQLRTPKLSKEFKPSIINEILSSSLQTLSEEDLRPMSEAIENMDGVKANLDALKSSREAAQKIARVYDRYNKAVLFDKTNFYREKQAECGAVLKKGAVFDQEIERLGLRLGEIQAKSQGAEIEQKVLEEERESLNASDAQTLKGRELDLKKAAERLQASIEKKTAEYEQKKELFIQDRNKQKKEQEALEAAKETIMDNLQEMGALAEDVSFDEHSFMEDELKKELAAPHRFEVHKVLLKERMEITEKALDALKEEKRCSTEYDRKLREFDLEKEKRDKAEREVRQFENQSGQIKNELTEQLYGWEQKNKELKLSKETLQQITIQIERFSGSSNYGDIKEIVREFKNQREDSVSSKLLEINAIMKQQKEELLKQQEELKRWETMEDPEPEIPEKVRRNREVLREKGISYIPFYKAIDFCGNLSEERRDAVEEALLEMGILDALIVPLDDREAIMKLDPGICDKYMFSTPEHVKECLLQVVEIDNRENDILFYQQVSNALRSIGYESSHHTALYADGSYQIGAITGTITKTYHARYIGVRAREEFRKSKVLELKGIIGEIEEGILILQEDSSDQKRQIEGLRQEFIEFPSGEDLRIAVREYENAILAAEQIKVNLLQMEEKLKAVLEELNKVKRQVQELCTKAYLPMVLERCEEARENFSQYKELLNQLEMDHHKYLEIVSRLLDLTERLEQLEMDMDNLLYDKNSYFQEKRTNEGNLHSVREQLKLTNYEQIRERMDYCSKRLKDIPEERIALAKEETDCQGKLGNAREERVKNELYSGRIREEAAVLKKVFLEEYSLHYVQEIFETDREEESMTIAERVHGILEGMAGSRKQSDLLADLQEIYHENRAELLEYQPAMEKLFEQEKEETVLSKMEISRVDIVAKYAGIKVKFKELLAKIEEDLKEQEELLSMKDRELFEDILANTISKKIRARIHASNAWVDKMNALMGEMKTSSGLTLSLKWRSKSAEHEEQLSTNELVELLKKDSEIMREEEVERISKHFRSKIEEARKLMDQGMAERSFHMIMREILDYRKWFEFQLECRKTGENKKELTDRVFFTFSGGEKAMAMYVPLFSAVVAKYEGANQDAPRMISLDEAFAGVDETNIKDMFRLMVSFRFDFIINSQILYGDYETVPNLAIYQLLRKENAKFVSVIPYHWNGISRTLVQ